MRLSRTPLPTRTALPTFAISGLLLAGCAGGTTTDAGGTPSPEPPTSPEETTETSPSPEETEGSDDMTAQGPECLQGDWTADVDATRELKLSAPGLEGYEDPQVEVTGDMWVSFDGSTMTTDYDNQVTELTLTLPDGTDVVVTTTLNGTVTASYTATDAELTVEEVDSAELSAETTASAGGQETAVPFQDLETHGVDLTGVSDYTCDEERLVIEPQDDADVNVRQVLTRDGGM